jgi:glycine cleavage system H lipoate-binding protein
MNEKGMNNQRSRVGFGSTYRKGLSGEIRGAQGIETVLGGQVWMVAPDQEALTPHPCVWMQAGTVKFKECNHFHDCATCAYDQGMRIKIGRGKQTDWRDAMRKKPALGRLCRHSLTNRIAGRACAYDYNCAVCDFDQFFEDVWSAKTAGMPTDIRRVKGFDVPMDYHFHAGHAWARMESGGNIRIGLDDFAQKLLGKADAIDLPLMGKEMDAGKPGWGIRRKDDAADVLAPVGGIIMEVNANARANPQIANQEPYGEGWLFLLRTRDAKQAMKNLMHQDSVIDWMNEEVGCLEGMIEEVAGPLAADGGYLADDIFGHLPSLGWQNLTRRFLKSGR